MFHSYISQRAIEHILEKIYRPLIKYIIGVLDILYTYVLEDVRNSELGEARVKRDVKHKLCTTIRIFKRMTVIFDQPASGIRQILSGLSKSNLNANKIILSKFSLFASSNYCMKLIYFAHM